MGDYESTIQCAVLIPVITEVCRREVCDLSDEEFIASRRRAISARRSRDSSCARRRAMARASSTAVDVRHYASRWPLGMLQRSAARSELNVRVV